MADVNQTIPSGKIIGTFTPTETFFSDELGSEYVEGMSYNLREGNDKLLALVVEWRKVGMVN